MFKGVFVGVLKSVDASVEADTTAVVGLVNSLIVVRAGVVVFDVSNVLVVLGIEDVIVMNVLLSIGEELLSVSVINCVFIVVKEGVAAESEVITGIGDLVVWILAVAGIVFFVLLVIEISVSRVVSVVGTEEECGSVVVVVFLGAVVMGEVIMVEVTLSVVVVG